MPLAYLDCFAGLSGDLFLGALVDLGYPADELRDVARRVVGDEASIVVRREQRHGIEGTRVLVEVGDRHHAHDEHDHAHGADDHHHHETPHSHSRAHGHTGLREIRSRIDAAGLPPRVKQRALDTFQKLAVVEGRIHGVSPEEVHFHEVGAVDALVDIVGTAAGVEALGLDPIVCAPPVLGSGFVKSQHGTMPVPAPATLALLEGVPVRAHSPAAGERTTPTGAALAVTLASSFGHPPEMVVRNVGYGVASADPVEVPNLLRVWVGDEAVGSARAEGGLEHDMVDLVEAEIDDMNPELFGYLGERLRAEGALDVVMAPVHMKKGRPGTSVRVVARAGAGTGLAAVLLRESTTTGARITHAARAKLARELREIDTPWGPIRVKMVRAAAGHRRLHPEYEDLRRVAAERQWPLVEVERRVVTFLESQEIA